MNTLAGKHDYQLQREEVEAFKERGVSLTASFERRRGRVCLIPENKQDEQEIIKIFLERWPNFEHDHTNRGGSVLTPDTIYIYFRLKFNT